MFLVVGLAIGCRTVQPDAGHEAVLVRKPLIFGSGGVDPTPVKTGLKYVAFTTTGIDVNMQPMRIDVEFSDLMTMDGVPIDFHAVLTVQVTDSVKLVRDFGPGLFRRQARLLDPQPRSAVSDGRARRREGARHERDGDSGDGGRSRRQGRHRASAGDHQGDRGTGARAGHVARPGNPPDAILHQRVETAAQEQRINTEKQKKLAEDQRKMAEESRAAAEQA